MSRSFSFLLRLLLLQFLIQNSYEQRRVVCPAGKAQFPNPDDRYSFYKCDAGGNPIIFHCPPKTWFNPRLEVCDWDTGDYGQSSGSSSGSWSPSGQGNTGSSSSAGHPPMQVGNNYNNITININVNGNGSTKPNNPSGGGSISYPSGSGNNPNSPPVGGKPQPSNPSGSGNRPQPNIPPGGGQSSSQPGGSGYPATIPVSKPTANGRCPPNGPLYYQNSEDCSTYFTCNQGRFVLTYCPRGLYYIPQAGRCESIRPTGCKFVNHNVGINIPIYEDAE